MREPFEWKAGHIEGSVHIPLGELPGRVDDVPQGRVVTVCASGVRSDDAARFLSASGTEAENLDGGVKAWAASGFELVRPDGSPGRAI